MTDSTQGQADLLQLSTPSNLPILTIFIRGCSKEAFLKALRDTWGPSPQDQTQSLANRTFTAEEEFYMENGLEFLKRRGGDQLVNPEDMKEVNSAKKAQPFMCIIDGNGFYPFYLEKLGFEAIVQLGIYLNNPEGLEQFQAPIPYNPENPCRPIITESFNMLVFQSSLLTSMNNPVGLMVQYVQNRILMTFAIPPAGKQVFVGCKASKALESDGLE